MKEVEGCKGETEEVMLLLLKKDAHRLPFSHLLTLEQMCTRIQEGSLFYFPSGSASQLQVRGDRRTCVIAVVFASAISSSVRIATESTSSVSP